MFAAHAAFMAGDAPPLQLVSVTPSDILRISVGSAQKFPPETKAGDLLLVAVCDSSNSGIAPTVTFTPSGFTNIGFSAGANNNSTTLYKGIAQADGETELCSTYFFGVMFLIRGAQAGYTVSGGSTLSTGGISRGIFGQGGYGNIKSLALQVGAFAGYSNTAASLVSTTDYNIHSSVPSEYDYSTTQFHAISRKDRGVGGLPTISVFNGGGTNVGMSIFVTQAGMPITY